MAENFPEMVKSSSVRLIKQDKGKENPSQTYKTKIDENQKQSKKLTGARKNKITFSGK